MRFVLFSKVKKFVRWLVLFSPFDFFNNILQVEVGDLKPVLLLINLLTIVKQVTLVNSGELLFQLCDFNNKSIAQNTLLSFYFCSSTLFCSIKTLIFYLSIQNILKQTFRLTCCQPSC